MQVRRSELNVPSSGPLVNSGHNHEPRRPRQTRTNRAKETAREKTRVDTLAETHPCFGPFGRALVRSVCRSAGFQPPEVKENENSVY